MRTGSDLMPVSVLSVGAVTAVGLDALATAAAIRVGLAGFASHPFMVDAAGDDIIVASVSGLPAKGVDSDRLFDMALPAAREALTGVPRLASETLPLVLAVPDERPGFLSSLGDQLAEQLANELKVASVELVRAGHAGGLLAVAQCAQIMRDAGCPMGLVGAIDSYLDAVTLEWLEAENQLHSPTNAYGFIPGEAAVFCVLQNGPFSEGRTRMVDVRSVARNTEITARNDEMVCTGLALSRTIQSALELLPPGAQVGHIICDLNGEPYRADEYAFTVPRISDCCIDAVDFDNPADCVGDVGAASGVLHLALAAIASVKQYARGQHILIWNAAESGERTAALLSAASYPVAP